MPLNIANKVVATHFFTQAVVDGEINKNLWICRKCEKTRKTMNGYTNLMTHLGHCIGPNFKELVAAHLHEQNKGKKSKQGLLDCFVVNSEKERRAHQIIEWIVRCNMPLSEIDNPLT
jgi:hypothetical protein